MRESASREGERGKEKEGEGVEEGGGEKKRRHTVARGCVASEEG